MSSPTAEETAPSAGQTTFLDLSDDIYGKLYNLLGDQEDRMAFRQSCKPLHRSKAVNKQISHCRLHFGPSSQAADDLTPLLAFPAHAELRTLKLSGSAYDEMVNTPGEVRFVSKMAHLLKVMDTAAKPESLRARMRTVDHLEIAECSIDRAASEKLCCLFPRLCTSEGPSDRPRTLRLEQCKLEEDAYGLLFSCMRLESLAIVDCILSDPSSHTPSLASLLSSISIMGGALRTLVLCYDSEETNERESKVSRQLEENSVSALFQPLEELRHLTDLHLGRRASQAAAQDCGAVRGLLSKLPLRSLTLSFSNACPVVPPSVEFVCLDLRLCIEPVRLYDLDLVVEMSRDLRQQKCVTVRAFMFDHQGLAHQLILLIKNLCSMPFEIKCTESFSLWSHESWDNQAFVAVLQTLQPIKQSFASVKNLGAHHVCVEPSALRALASLFEGCVCLTLGYEAQPMNRGAIRQGHDPQDEGDAFLSYERGGLQELLHGMPNLSYLKCRWDVELWGDYIQALTAACDAGRAFKLVIDAGMCSLGDDKCQALTALQQEWQHIQAKLPRRHSQKVLLQIDLTESSCKFQDEEEESLL